MKMLLFHGSNVWKIKVFLCNILTALGMAGMLGQTYLIPKFSHKKDFLRRTFTDCVNLWQIPKNDIIPWGPDEKYWSLTAAPTPRLTGDEKCLFLPPTESSPSPFRLYPKIEILYTCNFPGKTVSNHWCWFVARMWNRKCPEIWKIASSTAGGGGGLGNPWAGCPCPFSHWEMQKSRISHSWEALKESLSVPSIFSFFLTWHQGFLTSFLAFIPPVLPPIPLWGNRAAVLWDLAAGWG